MKNLIIGAMNNPHKKLVEEIYSIGEMNFDYVEVTIEHPSATPEKVAKHKKEVLDALGSYNLGVMAHCPWYFSIAHPYERIQKATVTEFNSLFTCAATLGAKKVTLHSETLSPSIQGRKSQLENAIRTLKELHKMARGHGLDLLIENLDKRSCSIEEFKQIFSEVDMGMTLDIGHASTTIGEGYENYMKNFEKRIRHVHLHDNRGKDDDHLPLGAGKMEIKEIVEDLKKRYDGTITLEVHAADRHYLEYSKDRLEELWFGKKRAEEDKEYMQPDKK